MRPSLGQELSSPEAGLSHASLHRMGLGSAIRPLCERDRRDLENKERGRHDLKEVDGAVHLVVELLGVIQLQAVLHRDLVRVWDVGVWGSV